MDATIILTVDAPIFTANLTGAIKLALDAHAADLSETLKQLVRDKTPVLTGALREDIEAGFGSLHHGDSTLAEVWVGTENQLEWWHRVYAPYQEGPSLGLSTYTNPPRRMFADTATGDGVAAVLAYGIAAVTEGVWMAAAGGGGTP